MIELVRELLNKFEQDTLKTFQGIAQTSSIIDVNAKNRNKPAMFFSAVIEIV